MLQPNQEEFIGRHARLTFIWQQLVDPLQPWASRWELRCLGGAIGEEMLPHTCGGGGCLLDVRMRTAEETKSKDQLQLLTDGIVLPYPVSGGVCHESSSLVFLTKGGMHAYLRKLQTTLTAWDRQLYRFCWCEMPTQDNVDTVCQSCSKPHCPPKFLEGPIEEFYGIKLTEEDQEQIVTDLKKHMTVEQWENHDGPAIVAEIAEMINAGTLDLGDLETLSSDVLNVQTLSKQMRLKKRCEAQGATHIP